MCGIVGYIGNKEAAPILIDSLKVLEYRGYDSAGVAMLDNEAILCVKTKGKVSSLEDKVFASVDSHKLGQITMGIGHTRWATHGKPDDINSHPHLSKSGKIAVVHNGIIENHAQLRRFLEEKSYNFVSETDTEVAAHLIEYLYTGDPAKAVREAANMLEGAYALVVLFADHNDRLIAIKKDSPLILGKCEGENMIASDIPAVLTHTRNIIRLGEDELAIVKRDSITVLDRNDKVVEPEILHIDWDVASAAKEGYEHFMLKEINEQPTTIQNTISAYVVNGKIDLGLKAITPEYLQSIDKIYITACGSAYHVGVVSSMLIEKYLRIPARAILASEFMYIDPMVDERTLVIVISQSGETSDTLNAMRYAKTLGAKTLSVVNILGSSISVESDDCIFTHAGPEIAVATTKAYSAQLVVMYMLVEYISLIRNRAFMAEDEFIKTISKLPGLVKTLIDGSEYIKELAKEFKDCEDLFFIGKGLDYALSLEASLKLKEISYIHSEAYAAGELKHGTLSLVQNGTLVIALCTVKQLAPQMLSSIKEVSARGANVIAVATEDVEDSGIKQASTYTIWQPSCEDFMQPSLVIIPMQLFSYYVAQLRGCEIDQPRNLAKSVTVK